MKLFLKSVSKAVFSFLTSLVVFSLLLFSVLVLSKVFEISFTTGVILVMVMGVMAIYDGVHFFKKEKSNE